MYTPGLAHKLTLPIDQRTDAPDFQHAGEHNVSYRVRAPVYATSLSFGLYNHDNLIVYKHLNTIKG